MIYKFEQEITNNKYLTYGQMNIIFSFQKLWLKVAIWIRTYIRSVIYDTRDKKHVANYLISLPNEFYPTFNMFYGSNIAQNITDLLLDFIKSAMELVEFKKYGESDLTNLRILKWYQSADKLSSYLSKINVYWDENQWKFLLYQYIKLKSYGISALVNNDYIQDVNQYNIIDNIIFIMGSYMARGIIASNVQQISSQYDEQPWCTK